MEETLDGELEIGMIKVIDYMVEVEEYAGDTAGDGGCRIPGNEIYYPAQRQGNQCVML